MALSGSIMVLPGITFIALGVLIIVWPSILPWLVAAACMLAGGGMLLIANFMRGAGARLRRAAGWPAKVGLAPLSTVGGLGAVFWT